MKLPFTVEPFFDVCIRYNESVWPMQFVLYVAALGTIVLLWLSPRARYVNRIISSILLFFWLWMAIAYHLLFLSAINRAAWLFGASLFCVRPCSLGTAFLKKDCSSA